MRIGRTIPPAAAPIDLIDLWYGACGLVEPARALTRFEDELRRLFGSRYVFTVSSGAAALTITLKALASMSDRTEVILPAYTCFTVPAAVLQAGLEPVLCDIDATTFDFDARQLEQLVSRRTLCVIAHHLFGMPTNIARVRAICETHGGFVVEDAAQAMGVDVQGRPLGTLGDVGVFSFGRGKHVTCGEGGVILTDRARLASAIERECRGISAPRPIHTAIAFAKVALMYVCIRPWLYWIPASLPFLRLGETIFPTHIFLGRLSGMHAGLMRRMQVRMQRARRVRMNTAFDFRRRLRLGTRDGRDYPYLRLPVFAPTLEQKNHLSDVARRRGLGLGRGYPTAVNEIPELRARFAGQAFPRARQAANQLVTIPTHHWLNDTDKQAIVDHLNGVVSASCPPEEAVGSVVVNLERTGQPGFQMTATGIEREGA
ncbi:MAG TPA: DegT/DnrJ/EryC1/StrS family aminotransferase [Vicinamibacterales bacterium]|nr:DegT/DnrJ/EryC1/StrS family aminotransferase [Vicinamibacterales bacterium]